MYYIVLEHFLYWDQGMLSNNRYEYIVEEKNNCINEIKGQVGQTKIIEYAYDKHNHIKVSWWDRDKNVRTDALIRCINQVHSV